MDLTSAQVKKEIKSLDNKTKLDTQWDARNEKIILDIRAIIEDGRRRAYESVNGIAVLTYWHIGKKIVEEEQHGENRATYGKKLIQMLASELTKDYGTGFTARNLRNFRQFYMYFPDIEIWHARVPNLSWSHFRRILSVANPKAREWYIKEASEQMWSTRTLDRNISMQYYERLLANQRDDLSLPLLENEKESPLEYIKNPVVAEFLGFHKNIKYDESELEQALIDHLQQFIMELGRGFAFVDRQKHINTDMGDFYIDLVFYNIKLHCYVLIDLKTNQIKHQDAGQMDMYVRMFDELVKGTEDNPTIGILLCSETSKDLARYSVLHDNDQLFAAKYMPFMPTREEIQHEIEQQKQIFLEQHPEYKPVFSH